MEEAEISETLTYFSGTPNIDHLRKAYEQTINELEPYFVFAHIVSPHPPYVFGSNGEEINHNEPFSLSGPGRKNGGAKNVKLYIDQLQYIDGSILRTVKDILRKSEAQSIIIIQSDHGPDSYNGENEIANANMKEEFAILNAYYFPHQQLDLLYSLDY